MEADGGIGTGPPWRRRRGRCASGRANGTIAGSGILLSPDRVLTCAHVVGRDEEVTAEFVGAPRAPGAARSTARVAGDAYRPEVRDSDGDPVGDVALLALDRPRPAAEATSLHRVSAPGRAVRMYGFPAAYNGGLWLPATILGGCGRDGQVQLEPAQPRRSGQARLQRRRGGGPGHRQGHRHGAGQLAGRGRRLLLHEPGGDHRAAPARGEDLGRGQTAVDEELRSAASGDDRVAARHAVRRAAGPLAARRAGDGAARQVKISLVPDDDPVRAATLRRAITLADRELRSRFSTGRPSLDSPGTVPAAGGLDLAVYATGRGTDEIAERIAGRMDLLQHRELPAAERIAAAAVTITLVVDGVDAAADPASLIGLLALLTSRGNRVLLVFRAAGATLELARQELLLRPAMERAGGLAGRLERIALGPGRELDGLMARVRGAAEFTDKAVGVLINVMTARAELATGRGASPAAGGRPRSGALRAHGGPRRAPAAAGHRRAARTARPARRITRGAGTLPPAVRGGRRPR